MQRFPDDAHSSPYIGRFGWNVLTVGGAIPDDELLEAVDASYEQVVAGLPGRSGPADRAVVSGPGQRTGPGWSRLVPGHDVSSTTPSMIRVAAATR